MEGSRFQGEDEADGMKLSCFLLNAANDQESFILSAKTQAHAAGAVRARPERSNRHRDIHKHIGAAAPPTPRDWTRLDGQSKSRKNFSIGRLIVAGVEDQGRHSLIQSLCCRFVVHTCCSGVSGSSTSDVMRSHHNMIENKQRFQLFSLLFIAKNR